MSRSLAKGAALSDNARLCQNPKITAGFACLSKERGLRVRMNTTVLCVRANFAPHTSRFLWLYISTVIRPECPVSFGEATFDQGT
jgi:hypothetical protein